MKLSKKMLRKGIKFGFACIGEFPKLKLPYYSASRTFQEDYDTLVYVNINDPDINRRNLYQELYRACKLIHKEK